MSKAKSVLTLAESLLEKKEQKLKVDYDTWKKKLPSDMSHVDSTKEKEISIAYKKVNKVDVEIGRYFHNAKYGTIEEK